MANLLEVKDLRVTYNTYAGAVQCVRGVSFVVEEGETLAVVGESGCGKSVTAKSILGLIKPPGVIEKNSEILFRGENVLQLSKKRYQEYRGGECSIIFQDALASLNPTMTIGKQIAENLIIHKNMKKREALREAEELLRLVGISQEKERVNQYPHEFSGGMRQRAMIAIAFACRPSLLIADEPTTALDVTIQAQILDLLKNLQKNMGTSILLITHDLGIVANAAKKIVVMYCGKIVEQGDSDHIFYSPGHPYTKALLESVPRLDQEDKKDLFSIKGTPPDLIAPPTGCPFSTRCMHCMEICCKEAPEYTELEPGHKAACWLHHPLAGAQDTTISHAIPSGAFCE